MALMSLFDGALDTVDSPVSEGAFSFSDAVSGGASWLGNAANLWAGVEVAKINANAQQKQIYFRGADGRLYQEGQTGAVVSNAAVGGISPLMLLLIAGGLFFALKD